MKSKTSFINRGILQNDFKRFIWISIVYLLGLLLAIPLKIFMIYNRAEEVTINGPSTYLRVLNYDSSALQFLLLVIIPVLTGLLIFRYLQSGQAADMKHSLPIRRETLYYTHLLSGIIILSVPLIITALASRVLAAGLGIEILSSMTILTWLGTCLLINLLFFMVTVAVGMFTGLTTVQGVLTYILLLLPSGLSILLLHNMKMYIYGFPYDHYCNSSVNHFSPLLRLGDLSGIPMQAGEVIIYLVISVLLCLLGRYLYQRRQLERAGNVVTFDVLGSILKYGVVFCSMLLAGSYFYRAQDNIAWTFFGYLLGSLLAYIFMEILLEKSLYVFKWQCFKGYGIYALLVMALVGLLNFDAFGYEQKLPQLSEVHSIYLEGSFYTLDNRNFTRIVYDPQSPYPYDPELVKPVQPIFTEPNNLAHIYALHKAIISRHQEGKQVLRHDHQGFDCESICMAYELKDGSRLYRQYQIARHDYAAQLKPIYESREHKKLHNEILRIDPAAVRLIELNTFQVNKQLLISRSDLIEQAITALQQDIYAQSYEEMNSRKSSWANISISLDQRRGISLQWQKSYVNFENWLIATGQYEKARILPEDISFALLQKISGVDQPGPDRYMEKNRSLDIAGLGKKPGVIKITAAQELEQYLRNYRDSYSEGERPAYSIVFKLKNDRILEGFVTACP